MEKYIDLHTHSNKSDGTMTPSEVVREAKKAGLSAIALSDHDCIDGVKEAVLEGEKIGVEVIPAIEFSVQSDTETHILGLFIDIENPKLLSTLENCKDSRIYRNKETCRLLNELGFDVTLEEVRALSPGDIIGRAHYGKLLVKKGYVDSVDNAFKLYLSAGRPAYCGAQHLNAKEVVELIKECGGLSFVAHLHTMKKSDEELRETLEKYKSYGLNGVEGYYTDYTEEMQEKYQKIAKELGLMLSGGSDFHAEMKPHISIGIGRGNLKIPYSILEEMKRVLL